MAGAARRRRSIRRLTCSRRDSWSDRPGPVVARVWADPEVAYTALRWDALAVGCLLALAPTIALRRAAPLGWAVILAGSFALSDPVPSWAYVAVAAAAVSVIGAVCEAPGWLALAPLRYLGRVSYGLYLWHVVFLRLDVHPVLAVAGSLAAAELSARFVETPFRRRHPAPVQGRFVTGDRQVIVST